MPKLWVDKKLYSVEGEVRDYVEKIELDLLAQLKENKRLKEKIEQLNEEVNFLKDGNTQLMNCIADLSKP